MCSQTIGASLCPFLPGDVQPRPTPSLGSFYAREIQRVYRGHLGRRRTRLIIERRIAAAAQSMRHVAAVAIQRVFRGHLSRRLRHDFHARKAYISAVHAQGEALRAQLQAQLDEQIQVGTSGGQKGARGMPSYCLGWK